MLCVEPQEAALSHELNIAEAWGVLWDEFRKPRQLKALPSHSGALPKCCGCQNPLRQCPHVKDRELYVSTMWNSTASGGLWQGHCAHEYSGGIIFSVSFYIGQGQRYMGSSNRTPGLPPSSPPSPPHPGAPNRCSLPGNMLGRGRAQCQET